MKKYAWVVMKQVRLFAPDIIAIFDNQESAESLIVNYNLVNGPKPEGFRIWAVQYPLLVSNEGYTLEQMQSVDA